MEIRAYQPEDKLNVITLIKQTIQLTNSKDYSKNQIKAWADIDSNYWDKSLINHIAIVAIIKEEIVGFSDMTSSGFLDRLFVHHNFQQQCIGKHLLTYLEEQINVAQYSLYASITALPFFEKMGYHVIKENTAKLRGEAFLNYYMTKEKQQDD